MRIKYTNKDVEIWINIYIKKNAELSKQVKEFVMKVPLAEQGEDQAQKQFLVFGERHKAGPFGTVNRFEIKSNCHPWQVCEPKINKNPRKVDVREKSLSLHLQT